MRQKETQNTLNEFIAVEVYDNIPIEDSDEMLELTEDNKNEFIEKKTPIPKNKKFPSYIDKLVFNQNKKLSKLK